jgi:hypothetical protein
MAERGCWVVLPVASVEQHGPALPVNVDNILVDEVTGPARRCHCPQTRAVANRDRPCSTKYISASEAERPCLAIRRPPGREPRGAALRGGGAADPRRADCPGPSRAVKRP